ncbi:MAG: hypothetical protein Q8K58_05875 [Acidimicrobiales bacterium]|nr:hypothetical protein [Acidimicrobiales bacterium]
MATGPQPSTELRAGVRSTTPKVDTSDWPAQAADTIERVVGTVRDKTTGPAITVARSIVYGTFALLVGTAVAVLLAVGAVRILDVYLPDSVVGEQHTWAAHLLVGAAFSGLGMFLWSRRSAPDA